MSLTATKPPQEVIDGLILDAAWEKARLLEGELVQARWMAKENRKSFDQANMRRLKLELGIGGLMTRLKGNPDTPVDSIVDALNRLLDDE